MYIYIYFIIYVECICIILVLKLEIDFVINVYIVNCLLIKFFFIRYGIIIVGNFKVLLKV